MTEEELVDELKEAVKDANFGIRGLATNLSVLLAVARSIHPDYKTRVPTTLQLEAMIYCLKNTS